MKPIPNLKERKQRTDYQILIIPDKLYNLSTLVGIFKIRRNPLKYRFLHYKPWHIFSVSPGEGQDYIGGLTVKGAFNNMINHYGGSAVVLMGRENKKFRCFTA